MSDSDNEWIVPTRPRPLEQYDRAAGEITMFKCMRFNCTMKAYHCIDRQYVKWLGLPRWTPTHTICSSGQCRQGKEMQREPWAQLRIKRIMNLKTEGE